MSLAGAPDGATLPPGRDVVFTGCEAPEAEFDPATASAEALAAHGLPPRPDPQREPALSAHWRGMFVEEPIKFITAELTQNAPLPRDDGFLQGNNFALGGGSARRLTARQLSRNWAGAVAGAHSGMRFNGIVGSWCVPTLGAASTEGEESLISAWIGLGGARRYDRSMPQMGSEHGWHADGNEVHRLWCQWWQGDHGEAMLSTIITNMPLQPGDKLLFSLVLTAPDEVLCHVKNVTQGGLLTGVRGRSRRPAKASSAEWVVERPAEVIAPLLFQGLPPADLPPLRRGRLMRRPEVGPIDFQGAAALLSTPDRNRSRVVSLRDAELLALYEVSNKPTRLTVPIRPKLVEQDGSTLLSIRGEAVQH